MKIHESIRAIAAAIALSAAASCSDAVEDPVRDNPKDPFSVNWTAERPDVYSVTILPDSSVSVKWVCSTRYGTGFRVERRIHLAAGYTILAFVPGSAFANEYIDRSNIPKGHTYDYRVGVTGPAGAITYSYDFAIDIY